jgi:hypothetical protein
MEMTKDEAERAAVRRWRALPADLRETADQAEAYAAVLVHDLEFPSVTGRERLIGAWLIRDFFAQKRAERILKPAKAA